MNLYRLLPPALEWRLFRRQREAAELALFAEFYSQFLNPGDLCFDIGANLGNRVKGFRAIGCKVVALEPQKSCFTALQKAYATDSHVTLRNQAAGRESGTMELHVSPDHVLSSFSENFMRRTSESGRFSRSEWNQVELCEITTLDALVAAHGNPRFIKIDVEGFESEVLAGLSKPVPALSIEWIPELSENATQCVIHLTTLGDYEFNLSWGESMRFSRAQWRTPESILTIIGEFDQETTLFGDIYARLRS